jgi:hypothetical protein
MVRVTTTDNHYIYTESLHKDQYDGVKERDRKLAGVSSVPRSDSVRYDQNQ